MLDSFLKLVFPSKCIFCGTLLELDKKIDICDACYGKIPFVSKTAAGSVHNSVLNCCFDDIICVCEYSGIIKQSVLRFKFYGKPSYYRAMGKLLAEKVKKVTSCQTFDIILSVPLHSKKEALRGYNQSNLVSKALSSEIGVPERSKLIQRIKNTESQSLLSGKMRYLNIRDSFKVKDSGILSGKTVLLVDDVLTTGNTLNECSRVLKEAGVKHITAAVIASGRKF